MMTLENIFVLY